VCELPSVLAYPLFYKLITPGETTVSHGAARAWLAQRQITQARRAPPALGPRLAAVADGARAAYQQRRQRPVCAHALSPRRPGLRQRKLKARLLTRARASRAQAEPVVRMFEILRKDECQWVAQADLKSMLAGILLSHPGLEFLQVGRPGPSARCGLRSGSCAAARGPWAAEHGSDMGEGSHRSAQQPGISAASDGHASAEAMPGTETALVLAGKPVCTAALHPSSFRRGERDGGPLARAGDARVSGQVRGDGHLPHLLPPGPLGPGPPDAARPEAVRPAPAAPGCPSARRPSAAYPACGRTACLVFKAWAGRGWSRPYSEHGPSSSTCSAHRCSRLTARARRRAQMRSM